MATGHTAALLSGRDYHGDNIVEKIVGGANETQIMVGRNNVVLAVVVPECFRALRGESS